MSVDVYSRDPDAEQDKSFRWRSLPLLLLLLLPETRVAESRPESKHGSEPGAIQRLDDLGADATMILRHLPGVAQVTRHGPKGRPSDRIVHLLDWHFVPRAMYGADLRSQSDEPINDKEIDRAWADIHAGEELGF